MRLTRTVATIAAGTTAGVAGLALGAGLAFGGTPAAPAATPTANDVAALAQATGSSHAVAPHRRVPPLIARVSSGVFTVRMGKAWVTAELTNGQLTSTNGSTTLSVQPRDKQSSPLSFTTGPTTKVFLRGHPGTLADLHPGDHVRVLAVQRDGAFYAVRVWCVRPAPAASPGGAAGSSSASSSGSGSTA